MISGDYVCSSTTAGSGMPVVGLILIAFAATLMASGYDHNRAFLVLAIGLGLFILDGFERLKLLAVEKIALRSPHALFGILIILVVADTLKGVLDSVWIDLVTPYIRVSIIIVALSLAAVEAFPEERAAVQWIHFICACFIALTYMVICLLTPSVPITL
jgi:hypothetical protein